MTRCLHNPGCGDVCPECYGDDITRLVANVHDMASPLFCAVDVSLPPEPPRDAEEQAARAAVDDWLDWLAVMDGKDPRSSQVAPVFRQAVSHAATFRRLLDASRASEKWATEKGDELRALVRELRGAVRDQQAAFVVGVAEAQRQANAAMDAAHNAAIEQAAKVIEERTLERAKQREAHPHRGGEGNRTRDRLAARVAEGLDLLARVRSLSRPTEKTE